MNRDHILRHCLPEPKACIEAFGNDIHEGRFGDEVDAHFRVPVQEFGDDFLNKQHRYRLGRSETQCASRVIAIRIHLGEHAVEILQNRMKLRDEAFPGRSGENAARRSVKQPHAESLF